MCYNNTIYHNLDCNFYNLMLGDGYICTANEAN